MNNPNIHNETELLARVAMGDEQAFTAMYDQTYPALYFFAKRYVGAEKAKDIVAESFVKLWKSPKSFDNLAHLRHYLRAIIRNACIDLLQHEQSTHKVQEQLQYLTEQQYDDAYQLRNELESLLYKKILDEIEKLPAFTKTIFKFSYLDGKKNAEIGKLLGIKEQTVRNKKAEALKILRKAFADHPAFLYFFLFS